jgi:hypothetical protein
MVEVQTSEVDAMPAPVSLAQQCVKTGKHFWATQQCTVVKHWASSLDLIVGHQLKWRVCKGIYI